MPREAVLAALQTFARVTRERHPGVVLVPLGEIRTDEAVVATGAGEVLWPFAAPEDRDALLDRHWESQSTSQQVSVAIIVRGSAPCPRTSARLRSRLPLSGAPEPVIRRPSLARTTGSLRAAQT